MRLIKIINKPGVDLLGREIFVLGYHSNGMFSHTISEIGDCLYQSIGEHLKSIEGEKIEDYEDLSENT